MSKYAIVHLSVVHIVYCVVDKYVIHKQSKNNLYTNVYVTL